LSKNGTRPIIYSAIGSHANYAVPGTQFLENVLSVSVNDFTSAGPIWDPTLSALYYNFSGAYTEFDQGNGTTNGTFVGLDSAPTEWLHFIGRWGDEQYPDDDPRQVNLLNLNITWLYETGPTGPLDKELNRTDICPDRIGTICTTLTELPVISGSSIPVTITRTVTTTTNGNSTAIATSSLSTPTGGAGNASVTTKATSTSTGGVTSPTVSLSVGHPAVKQSLALLCFTVLAFAAL